MIKMSFIGLLMVVAFFFNMYLTLFCGVGDLISQFWFFSFPTLLRGVAFTLAGGSATIAASHLWQLENFAAHQVDEAMTKSNNETTNPNIAR